MFRLLSLFYFEYFILISFEYLRFYPPGFALQQLWLLEDISNTFQNGGRRN